MGDTKETNTVTGAGNSINAYQGGYGPGPELNEKTQHPQGDSETKEKPEAISRQDAQATIESIDLEKED